MKLKTDQFLNSQFSRETLKRFSALFYPVLVRRLVGRGVGGGKDLATEQIEQTISEFQMRWASHNDVPSSVSEAIVRGLSRLGQRPSNDQGLSGFLF